MTKLYMSVSLLDLAAVFDTNMTLLHERNNNEQYQLHTQLSSCQIAAKSQLAKELTGSQYILQLTIEEYYFESAFRQAGSPYVLSCMVINTSLIKPIIVVDAYFARQFIGYIPKMFNLRNLDAIKQWIALVELQAHDFVMEIGTNRKAIFLHYPFWSQMNFSEYGISLQEHKQTLADVKKIWKIREKEIPLLNLSELNMK